MLSENVVQLPDAGCPNDENFQKHVLRTNQITSKSDRLDVVSYVADDSTDEDDDGTEVVPSSGVSLYDNVNVVNSNDVHIGNKTIYQGPVKIKQILYANNTEVINPHILDETILPVTCKDQIKTELAVSNGFVSSNAQSSKSSANGVDNPGFLNDKNITNGYTNENSTNEKRNGNQKGSILRCSGEYRWLWRKRIILTLIVIVTVILAISSAIQLFKNFSGQDSTKWEQNHVDENENESPLDYISDSNGTINRKVRIMSRKQWLAQPPIAATNDLKQLPVSLVIIQHSATESCQSQSQCVFQTRIIQMYHIESMGWNDIGYNFLVGGDGDAYEGRGWKKEGSHTLGYNYKSIGVCFIGTFINEPPPANQIAAFHHLMKVGVDMGYLTEDYKVLGAKQLMATLSPGEAFYRVIKTWKHWAPKP